VLGKKDGDILMKFVNNLSIKKIILIIFISVMLVSVSTIGFLIFRNWISSAKQTIETLAEELNESTYTQIYNFLKVPNQMNDTNSQFIENGIFDLSNTDYTDIFFSSVLSSYNPEIYSFSYGTEEGYYYGARRNEDNNIEIMKNDSSTGGSTWYYAVKENMTAGNLVSQSSKFDARTRAWYKTAVNTKSPSFSPVYKHFVMDDLTITYATPIYNESNTLQGVLGTHVLLKNIGQYLSDTVSSYNGFAVIFEKETNNLIANSLGLENFTLHQEGTLKRKNLSDIQFKDINKAYEKHLLKNEKHFYFEDSNDKLHMNVQELNYEGLNWVIVTAIPENLIMGPVLKSIQETILLTVIALMISFLIFYSITRKLLHPVKNLEVIVDAFSSGDLSKRVEIVRNDEIGKISESVNIVADKIQFLVNNLEAVVQERTEELSNVNQTLEENKNQLRLILDSSAEAIYGIDMLGNCTFCNQSCINHLGYKTQEDLLGKNMHQQIHYSSEDGTPIPVETCKIFMALKEKKGTQADDEVFWRSNGTSFEVEYYSYPQIKNNEIIGAVVTFMDITERKQKEQKIQYLSCHDTLTGIHNRSCFEDNRNKIDIEENLPLSVIFADINGLKMTNDIFGHTAGDELIKKTAEILLKSCRDHDVVARIGGDEFIILLPETGVNDAEKIINRIKASFLDARVEAIKCSISLGLETKTSSVQSLDEVMANAENAMYKDKTLNRTSNNKEIIDTIIETLHSKNNREKQHSIEVSKLCIELGDSLNLEAPVINKLERAGYLHDIGKIVLDKNILIKDILTDEEMESMRQHSVVGFRILNLFDDTLDLAEYVYSHHERWDGTGYPRGLEGEEIPLISRIIAIVETYERVLNRGENSPEVRKQSAIQAITVGSGKQFDPQLAERFVQLINKKIQE